MWHSSWPDTAPIGVPITLWIELSELVFKMIHDLTPNLYPAPSPSNVLFHHPIHLYYPAPCGLHHASMSLHTWPWLEVLLGPCVF